jgi:hypothetical protein
LEKPIEALPDDVFDNILYRNFDFYRGYKRYKQRKREPRFDIRLLTCLRGFEVPAQNPNATSGEGPRQSYISVSQLETNFSYQDDSFTTLTDHTFTMKFSIISIFATLLASNCDAFLAHTPVASSSSGNGFATTSTSLAFAPRGTHVSDKISEFNPLNFDTELAAATLDRGNSDKKDAGAIWAQFANWVTNTENRLYIGWFGTLMFPTLLAATTCFVAAILAAPPGKCI